MSDAPESSAAPQYDPNSPNGLSPRPDHSAQPPQTGVSAPTATAPVAPVEQTAQPPRSLGTGSFADRLGTALQDAIATPVGAATAQAGGFMRLILAASADALAPAKPAPESNAQRVRRAVDSFFAPMAGMGAGIGGIGKVAAADLAAQDAARKQQLDEQQAASREQREKLQFALNVATSNSQMLHSQYLLHKAGVDEMNANIADSQKALETFKNQRNPPTILGQDLTSDDVQRMIQSGSFNPSEATAYLTGKKVVGQDENGLPQYRGLYTVAKLPPDVRITDPAEAKSLFPSMQGLDNISEEQPLVVKGSVYNAMFQRRETVQAATAMAQKGADEAAIATRERADKIEAMDFAGASAWALDLATVARAHPDWSYAEQVLGAYKLMQATPPLNPDGTKKFPNLEADIAARLGEKNFNAIQTAAETARHNRQEEALKREELQVKQDTKKAEKLDMVMGYDQNGDQVMVTQQEAQALGLTNLVKAGAADVSQTMNARHYLGLSRTIQSQIAQLDKEGKLGTIASRWNEFMTGKVGAGDPEFESLRANLGLANTLLMKVHVGNRGGSQMLEHFEDLANGKKMDAKTLKAGIEAEYHYARSIAALPPALQASEDAKLNSQGAQPQLPPAAIQQLKEGVHTKFANGQTWTLQNGKPVQVQ